MSSTMNLSFQLEIMREKGVIERNKYLLENKFLSDCLFHVTDDDGKVREFAVHKLILSTSSAVFEKMFFGPMAVDNDQPIEIADISGDIFNDVLYFIYCDIADLHSVEHCQSLYTAADRFMIESLKTLCIKFICSHLSPQNVLSAFEFGNLFENEEVRKSCLKVIRCNTDSVLNSEEFLKIPLSTLDCILSETLQDNTRQLKLFKALEEYAKFHSYFIESTESKQKETVKNNADAGEVETIHKNPQFALFFKIVQKINYLSMTISEFTSGPALSKLLLPKDALSICVCICNPTMVPQHFPKGFSSYKNEGIYHWTNYSNSRRRNNI